MAAELYESVNVKQDPELRDALMANKINEVTCTGCEFSFRVDKTLLYSDPDHRLLVYLYPAAPGQYREGEDQFGEFMRNMLKMMPDDVQPPDVHLAFNRIEMVEIIFMVDAGLDPRLIEYIKYQIYSRNSVKIDPRQKILLFNAEDSDEDNLCFVVQDEESRRFESVIHYPRETYRGIEEMFGTEEGAVELLELFPGPYVSARALLREDSDLPPGTSRPD